MWICDFIGIDKELMWNWTVKSGSYRHSDCIYKVSGDVCRVKEDGGNFLVRIYGQSFWVDKTLICDVAKQNTVQSIGRKKYWTKNKQNKFVV